MYGTWLSTGMFAILAFAALIALIVLASPLFAVLFVLLALAFVASAFVMRRGQQAAAGGGSSASSGSSTAGGGTSMAGGTAPNPRTGGEPVSGEGHASGGETAGQRSSQRH